MIKTAKNQKGVAQVLLILLLLIGILAGVYLVQRTQIFKSRALETDVGGSDQIAEVNSPQSTESPLILRSSELSGSRENIDGRFTKKVTSYTGKYGGIFVPVSGVDENSYTLTQITTPDGIVYQLDIKAEVFNRYINGVYIYANLWKTGSENLDGQSKYLAPPQIQDILLEGQSVKQLRTNPVISIFIHSGVIKKDYINAVRFVKYGEGVAFDTAGSLVIAFTKSNAARITAGPDYDLEYENSAGDEVSNFELNFNNPGYTSPYSGGEG